MIVVPADELQRFAVRLLAAAGVDSAEAETVARSLVDANLCGHDSHGVVRIPDYARQIRDGELVPGAPLEPFSETNALLAADARLGFGQVQCARLIERLVPKARASGAASGVMRNCGHVGRLGEWAELIADRGLAGLVAVNDNGVLKCVAPPGGLDPCISTNPIAIGVPTGDGPPLVLDISTSAAANGKLRVAHLAGETVPTGWLQTADGDSTCDPAARFADPPATILPMGGDQGYKGFGLGLLLDVLTGGLSGGFCPPATDGSPQTNNVLFVLWDPARFAGESHFLAESKKLVAFARSVRRKPGVDAIRLPGDRANACRKERLAGGIPLDDGTWTALGDLARELSVTTPVPASAR